MGGSLAGLWILLALALVGSAVIGAIFGSAGSTIGGGRWMGGGGSSGGGGSFGGGGASGKW